MYSAGDITNEMEMEALNSSSQNAVVGLRFEEVMKSGSQANGMTADVVASGLRNSNYFAETIN